MEHRTAMQDLLEGSIPASPTKLNGPELAPGWGRLMDEEPATGAMRDLQGVQFVESNAGPLTSTNSNQEENAPASMSFSQERYLIQFDLSDNDTSVIQSPHQFYHPGLAQSGQGLLVPGPQPVFSPATPFNFGLKSYNMVGYGSAHQPSMPSGYYDHDRAYSPGVPEDANTCVWLTGFPADVTVTRFIDQVQRLQLGKIAAVHINQPTNRFPTAAIKATMWDRAGAERLFHAIESRQFGGFPNHRIRPSWSRYKEGPRALDNISSRFGEHFMFKLDRVHVHFFNASIMLVKYRFGSFINQASKAYRLVKDTFRRAEVFVAYRSDPCDPETGVEELD